MQRLERSDIATIRAAMKLFHFVVAEIDTELRYVWVDNAHPDFDPSVVVGKRDDELITPAEAEEIMALKRNALLHREPTKRVLGFQRSDGFRFYCVCAFPVRNASGAVDGLLTVGFDTPGVLRGILPICSYCKRIRDDQDVWQTVEDYVRNRTETHFSHGICPDCFQKYHAEPPAGGDGKPAPQP